MATFLDIKSLKDTLSGLLQSIPAQNVEQKLLFDDSSLSDIMKDIQEDIPVQEVEFDLLDDVETVELIGPTASPALVDAIQSNVPPKLKKTVPPPCKKRSKVIKNKVEKLKTKTSITHFLVTDLRAKALEFQSRLEKAVIACKNGSTLEEASQNFEVPKETIWRNVKNFKLAHLRLT